jgi:cytochrome P450
MPAYTYGAGNLPMLPDLLAKLPKGAQQSDAFTLLSFEFPKFDNCFYIDVWPFTPKPFLVVTSLELAVQACQTYALPKPASLADYFHPFTGGPNIFTTNGPEWKQARTLFNSAFSASTIMQQTAHIVQEAEVYVEILREHARKGDTFSLDRMTCDYLMDIIGLVAM